jgi:hypothetical protein
VILLYPLLLVGVVLVARRSTSGHTGPAWFGGWVAGGALFLLSLLTGLSVGLLIFPAAAVLLLWLARRAPRLRDASGFLLGVAVVLAVLFVAV